MDEGGAWYARVDAGERGEVRVAVRYKQAQLAVEIDRGLHVGGCKRDSVD